MKFTGNIRKTAAAGLLVYVLSVAAGLIEPAAAQGRGTHVLVPKLSDSAQAGKVAFDRTCAVCHGENAIGTDRGPPLLHDIYNPGHHGDAAFYNAVRRGSPQHHWRFGNMPPQPQVTDREVAAIVRYVRELQQANGIFFRPHRM